MILTPPTDSLYKFSAVAGLTLLIYLTFILVDHENKYDDRLYQLESKLNNTHLNLEILKVNLLNDNAIALTKSDSSKIVDINFKNIGGYKNIYFMYRLAPKYAKEYNKLVKEKVSIKYRLDEVKNQEYDYSFTVVFIFILIIVGEAFCGIGIYYWYEKVQKPSDNEYHQKVLSEEFYKDHCQSCIKTFIYFEERGTNSDGSKSKFFCETCYTNGSYVEPELTLKEAKKRLKITLAELKYSKLKIKRQSAKMNILMRWERTTKW